MEKTFKYQITTAEHYVASSDEYEYDYVEYEYTAEDEELKDAIVDILFDAYFTEKELKSFNTAQRIAIKKVLRNFTDDNRNWEQLAEMFEEDLKCYFEDYVQKTI
jgi:hypothetical protein